MRFPESIEGFVRVAVTDYSADESDIGVGYNLNDASRPAAVTVYVYPAGEVTSFGSPPEIIATALAGLDSQHFRAIQNDIVTAHPGAILLIEDRFSLQNSIESPQAYRAKYKYMDAFAGMRRQVVSDAYLIRRGNWWITFRISMPAEQEAQARQAVEAFINALQLPPSNS